MGEDQRLGPDGLPVLAWELNRYGPRDRFHYLTGLVASQAVGVDFNLAGLLTRLTGETPGAAKHWSWSGTALSSPTRKALELGRDDALVEMLREYERTYALRNLLVHGLWTKYDEATATHFVEKTVSFVNKEPYRSLDFFWFPIAQRTITEPKIWQLVVDLGRLGKAFSNERRSTDDR